MKGSLSILLLSVILYQSACAYENYTNARQFAMSGAFTALAQGSQAAVLNPANLAQTADSTLSLTLAGIAVNLSNNTFQKHHYDKYNGKYLNEYDIDHILNAIPAQGVTGVLQAGAQPISIAYGSFAVFLGAKHGTFGTFAEDLFELAFHGNEIDKVYHFQPLDFESTSFMYYGASLGHRFQLPFDFLPEIDLGLSLALYRGYSYYNVQSANIRTVTSFEKIYAEGHAAIHYAEKGKGIGMSFAAAATFLEDMRTTLMIENAVSNIKWQGNPTRYFYEFTMQETNAEEILEKEDIMDELFETVTDTTALASFKTKLPRIIRLGAAKPINEKLCLTMDVTGGFSRTAFSTPKLITHFAAEYELMPWMDIRGGFYVGGELKSAFSAGAGFHTKHLWFDMGIRSYGGVLPNTSKGVGAAFSISYRH